MQSVAIVGAGAIGATVGGVLLQTSSAEVVFCSRTKFDQLDLKTPDQTFRCRPEVLTDPAQTRPADLILVATKTYDAAGAWKWIERLHKETSLVAVLQNGVEHLSRFPNLPASQVLPVIVDIPAEREAPGVVNQARHGSMLVPAGDNGDTFAELFSKTPIEVQTTEDWLTDAWRKLAINCAGAVNALTLKPAGIVENADVADLMRALVRECVAVGNAEGAKLSDKLPEEVVNHYRASPVNSVNSLHADRLAGRPNEADARNGVISRMAARHGLSAPLNKMAATILSAS